MQFNFESLVKDYYQNSQNDDYPRLRGWEFMWDHVCKHGQWKELVADNNIEKTALHLGFYLANWGMFRGSSGLLNTNLDFLKDLICHLSEKTSEEFWNLKFSDFDPDESVKHKQASKLFDETLSQLEVFRTDKVTWTETLKTKILLGLWGQCPALDTYYRKGIKRYLNENDHYIIKPKGKINSNYLTCINVICKDEGWKFEEYLTHHENNIYPPGKIIDMAFFQYGINNT